MLNASTKATFAPRHSTTVPSASHIFEPAAKSVLRHRLLSAVFAYSAAFSLASAVLLAGSRGDGDGDVGFLLRLIRPSTWAHASLAWLAGVLPVLVVRKFLLTSTPAPASSPSTAVAAALAKPSMRSWVVVYVSSALLLLSLDLARTCSASHDVRLGLFVKSRKHPYYINGRLVFLVLAQVWLAVSFSLRNVMLERFAFRWAKESPSLGAPFLPKNLAMLLLTIALFALSSFALFNVAFGLVRLALLPLLLRVPVLRSLLKPFVGHFVRGPWTLSLPFRHLSLESHAFTLGLSMLANWEFAESLFDVYIPQPIKVSSTTADPNVTAVSGITSANPLFLHFAYAELRDVALDSRASSSARRTALFSDQKFSPSLWNTLARESLVHLGRDYQTFLRRGAPAPADAPAPTAPTKAPQPPPSTPLLRKAIYKSSQQSPISKVLDTFASDSDLSKAADSVASEVGTRVKEVPIPELFRSVSSPSAAAPPRPTAADALAAAVPISQPTLIGTYASRAKVHCMNLIEPNIPPWCRRVVVRCGAWWKRDRVHKLAEKSLPNRDLDALVVQVLSGLVCASLTEDRYGVVQRDIPRIVEAFLSFLSALEAYHTEVTRLYVPPTPDEITRGDADVLGEKERTRVEVAKASEVIGVVADALKSGVADIARTFGEKLVAFKFPPGTAKKLQSFVDYA